MDRVQARALFPPGSKSSPRIRALAIEAAKALRKGLEEKQHLARLVVTTVSLAEDGRARSVVTRDLDGSVGPTYNVSHLPHVTEGATLLVVQGGVWGREGLPLGVDGDGVFDSTHVDVAAVTSDLASLSAAVTAHLATQSAHGVSVAAGKLLQVLANLTLTTSGGEGYTITFPASMVAAGANIANVWTANQTFAGVLVNSRLSLKGTNVNDANATISATDTLVAMTALTAPRTLTLPAANTVATGRRVLVIKDESGQAGTHNITVQRAGSDTLEGGVTSKVINTNHGVLRLYSNGSTQWYLW